MVLTSRININDENSSWYNNIQYACNRVDTYETAPDIMEQSYLAFLDLMFALYSEQNCEIEQIIEIDDDNITQQLKFYVDGQEVKEDVNQLMADTNQSVMDDFIKKGAIKENG